jgi:tetratricopeptide (TPR) repeat protein
VLAAAPDDPSAWNNLGNANAGLGRWDEALACFSRAVALAPNFSFAAANEALALWATDAREPAVRKLRALLRRYPGFDDARAALAAALWAAGREGDAETAWARVDDSR